MSSMPCRRTRHWPDAARDDHRDWLVSERQVQVGAEIPGRGGARVGDVDLGALFRQYSVRRQSPDDNSCDQLLMEDGDLEHEAE